MARAQKGRKYASGLLTFLVVLFLLLLALSVGGVLSYSYVKRAQENFNNPKEIIISPEERVFINIPRGSGTDAISKILEQNGIIQYPQLFKILSKVNGFDGSYKSGTHIVSKELTYDELMIVLKSDPEILRLTFPEGLNSRQFYDVFESSELTHGGEIETYIEDIDTRFDYSFLDGLYESDSIGERDNLLEGYLFPDTYDFDLNATPASMVEVVLDNFESRFSEEYIDRAQELGMTIDEVIILASIIEREAKSEEDRFLVSGVFHNRMNSKDESTRRLQSCATIQYIYYMRDGVMLDRITDRDTRVVDAYNTYTHEGLPPGPICSPGLSSIKAALYPEETEYLFFVARGDGTHVFSKTYEEHEAAILEHGLNLMP